MSRSKLATVMAMAAMTAVAAEASNPYKNPQRIDTKMSTRSGASIDSAMKMFMDALHERDYELGKMSNCTSPKSLQKQKHKVDIKESQLKNAQRSVKSIIAQGLIQVPQGSKQRTKDEFYEFLSTLKTHLEEAYLDHLDSNTIDEYRILLKLEVIDELIAQLNKVPKE